MLNKNVVRIMKLRTQLCKWHYAAFDWDRKANRFEIVTSFRWVAFAIWSIGGVGIYCVAAGIQIYTQLSATDIPEEDPTLLINTSHEKLMGFAVLMIQYAEVILIIMILFLQWQVIQHRTGIVYLQNQMIDYNIYLLNLLETKKIQLDSSHQKAIKMCERFTLAIAVLSAITPIAVVLCLVHPIEPTHIILQEWFEIDFSFRLKYLPIVYAVFNGVMNYGDSCAIVAYLVTTYFFITVPCLQDITPIKTSEQRTAHILVTRYYGQLEDMEIIRLARTLQLFGKMLTEICGHASIAFHHFGLLAACSTLICFVVKYNDIMSEEGVMGYMLVLVMFVTPLALVWCQSMEGGALVDASMEFKNACCINPLLSKGRKGKIFRKFGRSCTPLYIPMTLPFYHLDRSTFIEFCHESINKAIDLIFM